MHIKVIEQSHLIYRQETFEGIVELDGKQLKFRYSEDDNGSELYLWNEETKSWDEMDYDNPSHTDLSDICGAINPEEFGPAGSEWDVEPDDL